MTKATHNGICQVCGALQAVNPETDLIANHGYSVEGHQHNDTCPGSRHLPLQFDSAIAQAMVLRYETESEQLSKDAEGEITKVTITVRSPWGREQRLIDREEYISMDHTESEWRAACKREVNTMLRRSATLKNYARVAKIRIEMYRRTELIPRKGAAA